MPALHEALFILLITAVIFVNGWTDAPNAIACAVSTGALAYKSAVTLAAVCNLSGLLLAGLLNASVADTVFSMVRFDASSGVALKALCAAMLAIVLFSVGAWWFGIPTSESHALIAAVSGAALALGQWGGLNPAAWIKILLGLVLSVALGWGGGFLCTKLFAPSLEKAAASLARRVQILAAGGMAFMHGAQDGQKFIAVFVTGELLAKGQAHTGHILLREHMLVLILCALVMALGTTLGGKRIVDAVGGKMVRLRAAQGACADLGAGFCLLFSSLFGIPMSTTHTKTTAMMGAGAAYRGGVDYRIVRGIAATWLITFPACGILGFVLTRLFCV